MPRISPASLRPVFVVTRGLSDVHFCSRVGTRVQWFLVDSGSQSRGSVSAALARAKVSSRLSLSFSGPLKSRLWFSRLWFPLFVSCPLPLLSSFSLWSRSSLSLVDLSPVKGCFSDSWFVSPCRFNVYDFIVQCRDSTKEFGFLWNRLPFFFASLLFCSFLSFLLFLSTFLSLILFYPPVDINDPECLENILASLASVSSAMRVWLCVVQDI
ncbi:hypothetical protein B0T20DRAFT_261683 [Sordaria brevicollis]|uniref:Transmembrane protein n=1 Tax=Sordaria brevicollis TaxID=83679 RepID=A0AAE0PA06_SORBR|nr:hypothetical protein B0T20DRAFT_261683 [Sordaria brevicollis]